MAEIPNEFGFYRPRYSIGGPGWKMDWEGQNVMIKAVAAARIGIAEAMDAGVEHAKTGHPDYPPASVAWARFANRTQQTLDAIGVLSEAQVDWGPEQPHVFGRWGVRSDPAFYDQDVRVDGEVVGAVRGDPQPNTIESRAMFLEFGTGRMMPRPFLYPAWDATKGMAFRVARQQFALMGGGGLSSDVAFL